MPAFTKGKWIDCGDYTIGVEDENGYIKYYICECESVDFHITDEEARANARLIAAAPDMYFTLLFVIFALGLDNSGKSSFISVSEEHAIFLARKIKALLARIDGREDYGHAYD